MTRDHTAVVYWYIRNAGAIGFGPFASLTPRMVIHVVEELKGSKREKEWRLMPEFSERDLEQMPAEFPYSA